MTPHPLDRLPSSPTRGHQAAPCHIALIGLAALLSLPPATRADWPEFRGPTGDGHALAAGAQSGLPLEWSETRNVRWKTALPHRGWSAPVVLGNQIWVTTASEDGHEYFAIGLDAATGAIRFHERVFQTDHPEPLGNGASMNSYATPSSLIEPGRVYVHFGSAGTACLDTANGTVLWKRNDLPCRHYRGPSSSLVSYQDLLILTMDGADAIPANRPSRRGDSGVIPAGRSPNHRMAGLHPHPVEQPTASAVGPHTLRVRLAEGALRIFHFLVNGDAQIHPR